MSPEQIDRLLDNVRDASKKKPAPVTKLERKETGDEKGEEEEEHERPPA
jgi:hypothetical protein